MEETKQVRPDDQKFEDRLKVLRRRASIDALSGLLNRDTMEDYIRDRLARMTPEESCALIIVDMDNFKLVNDTLGHQAGDQAIRKTAQLLSGLFRASDIVGRLGGDEFAVFLCGNITEKLIRRKGSEICKALQMSLGDRQAVNLTASVGIYLVRGTVPLFEELYQEADHALYRAKKAGKNGFYLKCSDSPDGKNGGFQPVNTIPLGGLLEYLDSGVALLEMGKRPKIIYVSPSYCRLIGTDAESFPLPQPLDQRIHPDDVSSLEQALREGLEQGKPVEHTHRVMAGGRGDWLWWRIRAIQVDYDSTEPVMLITATDISQFKETEQRQEETIRRLQAAFDQTSKQIWEVDLTSRVFRAFGRDGKYQPLGDSETHFPEHLIDGGWIHPGSISRFRTFAQELLDGRAQGYGNFAVRNRDTGYYNWASISYRVLFDDAGQAVRAVGVLADLPRSLMEQDSWTPLQRSLPEGLLADLIVRMHANLDLDRVESLWIEGSNLSGQVEETRCSQILQMERRKIFCKEDQKAFTECFERERLLELYQAGRRWMSAEYRRVDSSGSIRPARYVLFLSEDPETRQVHLFVYLIRLDVPSRMELLSEREIYRDPASGLYDRETVERMAESLFADRREGNRAVAILQISGQARPGGEAEPLSEQLRHDIAAALLLALGGSCIPGAYSPTQVVVLFPSVSDREDLRRRMEEALSFLRRVLTDEMSVRSLRMVMGISLLPAASARYRTMLLQAIQAGAFCWNATGDTVAFAQEIDDRDWMQMQSQETQDEVSVHLTEMARPLSEREKDVAFDCVSTMLTARTLDASLVGVLRTIGTYYRADRVYTMMLVENRHAVVMTFEWTSAGKSSIQQVVSGMRLDRFPLLERCLNEQAPVFLTRSGDGDAPGRPWYYTALPLIRDGVVEGFLCIENARAHPEDAALFATLIPYMLLERERFQAGDYPSGATEQLMGLPDLRAYMEAVYHLTSERYSSMGAVCLDIPGLASINSSYGFEYGSRLLWYVAKTLIDLFGPALLFRTWDAEFVIFLPNTTREVFLGRCGRLRSILQRRYPKSVRIGRAWSEGTFTGKTLVKEAKAAMQTEKTDGASDLRRLFQQTEEYPSVGDAARAGRFTVYFQPKVRMDTGRLAGAEALVRGVGEDGSIIPPAQFIGLFEEDGSIRDLDFFVLEQALEQANRWREAGLGVVPISVNLSRVSLVHPSTLASVLAVQSRYPDFPAEALELEITERGGGIETGAFRGIVERFRSCGLQLSLDDFGSQYANLPLFTNVRFDTVKLDRSLITELVTNPINRALIRDIIQICQAYDMGCVAEGVETEEQADTLVEMGCCYAQGYYYDRPLPAEEFERKYLREPSSAGEAT